MRKPLYKLVKKKKKWNWGVEQEKAFKGLKYIFITELVLVASDLGIKLKMEVDILDYVIRGVLWIKCENEK